MLPLLLDVPRGLQDIHRRGWMHRDVKALQESKTFKFSYDAFWVFGCCLGWFVAKCVPVSIVFRQVF